MSTLPKFVVLCGIGYTVTVHEGLIVFEEAVCFYGFHARIAFQRSDEPGGGPWYFQFSNASGWYYVAHVVAAYNLLGEIYGFNFEEKQKV